MLVALMLHIFHDPPMPGKVTSKWDTPHLGRRIPSKKGNPRTEDRFPAPKRKVRKMGKETQRWHPILLEKPLVSAIKKCTVLIPKFTHLEGIQVYELCFAVFCLRIGPVVGTSRCGYLCHRPQRQKIEPLTSWASLAGLLFEETSMGPAVSKSPSTRWIFSFQYLK